MSTRPAGTGPAAPPPSLPSLSPTARTGPRPTPGPTPTPQLPTLLITSLRNGLDVAVLAMWLGHENLESVNAYIHADPTIKQRALDRLSPLNPAAESGRYKPTDQLLAFLEDL